jgi:hypothetical protein
VQRFCERGAGDGRVEFLAAEQLLLELADQGLPDVGVLAGVAGRLVEALGHDREAPGGVDDLVSSLLDEEHVVGGVSVRGRSRECGQRQHAAHAQPRPGVEDAGHVWQHASAQW